MSQKLSIVIPCFNESKNIQMVVAALKQPVMEGEREVEIVVIDGGSTDDTPKELEQLFKELPSEKFKLILKQERGGYGNDIMEGLSHATGDVLSWTHADMQTDPEDVFKAYDLYLSSTQNSEKVLIKGQRKNRRLMEAFFTFGMQVISYFALRVYLSDINAQPKLFSKEFYNKFLREGHPSDFSLDLFALYQAKTNDYTIKTIPVVFKKRMHGEAKGGGGGWKMRLKLIKRTFKYIFKLKSNLRQS